MGASSWSSGFSSGACTWGWGVEVLLSCLLLHAADTRSTQKARIATTRSLFITFFASVLPAACKTCSRRLRLGATTRPRPDLEDAPRIVRFYGSLNSTRHDTLVRSATGRLP